MTFGIDLEQCICSQLLSEFECMNSYQNQFNAGDIDGLKVCIWYLDKCQNLMDYISDISCSSLNKEQCIASGLNVYRSNPICFYNAQTNACTKFTRCDYQKFSSSKQADEQCPSFYCLSNGISCSFDQKGRQEQYCNQIVNQDICNNTFLKDKKQICEWIASKKLCIGRQISICLDLNTQIQCEAASTHCYWNSIKCIERTCQDQENIYLTQTENCMSFYSLEQAKYIYCGSDGTQCNSKDPYSYNKLKCNQQSRNTFFWNITDNSCDPCLPRLQGYIYMTSIIIIMFI